MTSVPQTPDGKHIAFAKLVRSRPSTTYGVFQFAASYGYTPEKTMYEESHPIPEGRCQR
jgi:hypothetical protein